MIDYVGRTYYTKEAFINWLRTLKSSFILGYTTIEVYKKGDILKHAKDENKGSFLVYPKVGGKNIHWSNVWTVMATSNKD